MKKINILPNIQELTLEDVSEPLTDYLNTSAILWIQDIRYSTDKLNDIFEAISHRAEKSEEVLPLSGSQLTTGRYLLGKIPDFRLIEFGARSFYPNSRVITFNTTPQPAFNKNFNLLAEDLLSITAERYKNYIISDNEKQIERLTSIFHDINHRITFTPLLKTLHEGFIDRDLKIKCYTDHQLFERFHKYTLQNYFTNRA